MFRTITSHRVCISRTLFRSVISMSLPDDHSSASPQTKGAVAPSAPPSFTPWLTLFHSSGEHRPRSIRGAVVAGYSHVAGPRNKERDEETKRAKRPSACAADGLVTAAALRLWERWARECARPGWIGRNLLAKAPRCLVYFRNDPRYTRAIRLIKATRFRQRSVTFDKDTFWSSPPSYWLWR